MIKLDEQWGTWLRQKIEQRTAPEMLIKAMTGAGFDAQAATYIVLSAVSPGAPPAGSAPKSVRIPPFPTPATASTYVNDVVPISTGNTIDAGDRIVEVTMRLERPCVMMFDNVLSDEECAGVIERAEPRLKPSAVVNPETGKSELSQHRVSEGMVISRCEDAFITVLEERIARLLNWPLENGEGMSVLRYKIGDQYHPHYDYFPPQNPGSQRKMAVGGQRVSTLIMYLSDVEAGGETFFPRIGLSVTPKKGSAVYFQYCNADGGVDPLSFHGGRPVVAGEKWIMTKWMRQQRFGL
ncbi:MAG TPA: 2OG-Fe(II) oxygenase [Rhodocyclaceae bacterium]|nr:2OG-Fe(II) oxygenase [Rhodocyclaceae bacterium]